MPRTSPKQRAARILGIWTKLSLAVPFFCWTISANAASYTITIVDYETFGISSYNTKRLRNAIEQELTKAGISQKWQSGISIPSDVADSCDPMPKLDSLLNEGAQAYADLNYNKAKHTFAKAMEEARQQADKCDVSTAYTRAATFASLSASLLGEFEHFKEYLFQALCAGQLAALEDDAVTPKAFKAVASAKEAFDASPTYSLALQSEIGNSAVYLYGRKVGTTDAKGSLVLNNLHAGRYFVAVKKDGYQSAFDSIILPQQPEGTAMRIRQPVFSPKQFLVPQHHSSPHRLRALQHLGTKVSTRIALLLQGTYEGGRYYLIGQLYDRDTAAVSKVIRANIGDSLREITPTAAGFAELAKQWLTEQTTPTAKR